MRGTEECVACGQLQRALHLRDYDSPLEGHESQESLPTPHPEPWAMSPGAPGALGSLTLTHTSPGSGRAPALGFSC